MQIFKLIALASGIALFTWMLRQSDLATVGLLMARVGWSGIVAIVANFGIGFVADVVSWLLMFRTLPANAAWAARLWLVQMVGEALNVVTPFGSFGGEPAKAMLLNRHYGVAYTEGSASLLLIQTVNSLAQVPFLLIAVALLVARHLLPPMLEHLVLGAAAVISVFMALVLAALHGRLLAAIHRRLKRSRWRGRFDTALHLLEDIEGRLFFFLRATPARFAASCALAFANWVTGAVELWLVFGLLGHPLNFGESWLVEGTVVIARSVSFFVPAHLGVQDSVIALLGQALTGSSEIGVAVALVRRGRELAWSALGLAIGGWFGLRKPATA